VLALGGNSIVRAGEQGTVDQQWAHTDETTAEIAELWAMGGSPLIITHGNGPQVGRCLLRSELASSEIDPLRLDVVVADTEAGMGYMIEQLLGNHLRRKKLEGHVVTLITRVEVNPADPAFGNPEKPIGLFYSEGQAAEHRSKRGWVMAEDAGRGWRRVVPSPRPLRILELEAIRCLAEHGHIVVAVGGGGIPVCPQDDGTWMWCEGVIDKDLASALLAQALGVKRLVIVTSLPTVCLDWGKPTQREISKMTLSEAQAHLDAGQFAPGSMAPKIQAAVNMAQGGGVTIITQRGECGTQIVPD
jgi:carbamate kinase